MARLDVLTPSQVADPEVRAMLEASGDEMYGVYGHCPELFKAFLEFYRPAKYAGHLPFELKELVRLRVARYELSPPQWPAGFKLKIAVIADLHACDPWMSLERIEGIV